MNSFFQFQKDKHLSELSTFGIGGPAKAFIEATTTEQLSALMSYSFKEKIPTIVIGKGSNCLFDDRGFDGLVILNKIAFMHEQNGEVYVGAGYSFSLLGAQMAKRGLSGLEFASGIPASIGGAIYMNAGASGAEVESVVSEVEYVTEEGSLISIPRSEMTFSYRTSSFQKMKGAIAAAKFKLHPFAAAREKQLNIIAYRTKTQPYGEKSAGCLFRNPAKEQSAGSLIEQCGLKGTRIGGAEVSLLHANFIINKENATASDVLELAGHVKQVVKDKKGIDLEVEVRFIPFQKG